ncbi:enoyl-CoA delta isomerase 2, peroxisomal-like [Typha latifolia]|uniref:enoyl-CoA delta isomerase 2, peroxisomal-like n=1 Tax=Typha latifolia TaxID=4733 RepID=UPI003C2D9C28
MCTLEKRGRVFVLTLTGDGEHRLDADLISSLRSALATVRSSPSSSAKGGGGAALVTVAEGRFFSNGFDLAWANAAGSLSAARARLGSLVALFAPVVADFFSLPMPTIAAVTGHAAAAGLLLALSHDYVLMRGDRGVLYMSELNLGLTFPPYFMAVMREKITYPRALRDVALRASKIAAKEAKERGIVDRVCGGAAETAEEAMRLGEELAAKNWDGGVYASIRMSTFPEICRAVGLVEESDEQKQNKVVSKL